MHDYSTMKKNYGLGMGYNRFSEDNLFKERVYRTSDMVESEMHEKVEHFINDKCKNDLDNLLPYKNYKMTDSEIVDDGRLKPETMRFTPEMRKGLDPNEVTYNYKKFQHMKNTELRNLDDLFEYDESSEVYNDNSQYSYEREVNVEDLDKNYQVEGENYEQYKLRIERLDYKKIHQISSHRVNIPEHKVKGKKMGMYGLESSSNKYVKENLIEVVNIDNCQNTKDNCKEMYTNLMNDGQNVNKVESVRFCLKKSKKHHNGVLQNLKDDEVVVEEETQIDGDGIDDGGIGSEVRSENFEEGGHILTIEQKYKGEGTEEGDNNVMREAEGYYRVAKESELELMNIEAEREVDRLK